MNLKAWLLILFITSLPFILLELVYPELDFFSGGVDASPPVGICYLQAELACIPINLSSSDGILRIKITNSFDQPIVVTKIGCSRSSEVLFHCGESVPGGRQIVCDLKNQSAKSVRISPGSENEFILQCTDENGNSLSISRKEAFEGKINIEYSTGAGPPLGTSGTIIQEAD